MQQKYGAVSGVVSVPTTVPADYAAPLHGYEQLWVSWDESQPDAISCPHGQMGDRFWCFVRHHLKLEMTHEHRQQCHPFDHRKSGTGADM